MLRGDGVTLGPLERSHLEVWREWTNDAEIAALVDRVLPVTEPEHERFFERYVCNCPATVWFSMSRNEDGRYIGNIWLWNINQRHRNAEIRVIVGERTAWGTGAGSEAIALLARYAFDQIGMHKLYAYVMERNPRARRAFEKAGFEREATLTKEAYCGGAFTDVWRMVRFAAHGQS